MRDIEVMKITEQSLDVTEMVSQAPPIDVGYIFIINRYINDIPMNILGDGLLV